jgi:hypothetical protein
VILLTTPGVTKSLVRSLARAIKLKRAAAVVAVFDNGFGFGGFGSHYDIHLVTSELN